MCGNWEISFAVIVLLISLPPYFLFYPPLDYHSLYNFSSFHFFLSSILHLFAFHPLIYLLSTHLLFFSLFGLPPAVTDYIEVSLLAYAIVKAGEKQKRDRKNGRWSFFPPKRTATRSIGGQHYVFDTNIVITRPTTISFIFSLGPMHC